MTDLYVFQKMFQALLKKFPHLSVEQILTDNPALQNTIPDDWVAGITFHFGLFLRRVGEWAMTGMWK